MELIFKLKPTYTLVPEYINKGKGKNKQNVLNRIRFKFSFHNSISVNGTISKKDIDALKLYNIDPYGSIVSSIISELIIQTNQLFDTNLTHDDFREFYEDNMDIFKKFINDLMSFEDELNYGKN